MSRQLILGRHLSPSRQWWNDTDEVNDLFAASTLVGIANRAEDALLDVLFRSDGYGFTQQGAKRFGAWLTDALVTLTSVSATTKHIGLVATVSTTFSQPYHLARQFQTLDQISGGRAAWNAVTSFGGAENFGLTELPRPEDRYAAADEFLTVVHSLWGAWAVDAVVLERDGLKFGDPDRITSTDFEGEYFSVKGTGSVPRSPQGWPVQFQAGATGLGKDFAAKHAEAIFSASPTLDHARAIYADIKGRVSDSGRDPNQFLILPGLNLTFGRTAAEVAERVEATRATLDFDGARRHLEFYFGGVDLSDLELDEPLPEERIPDTATLRGRQSRPQLFIDIAREPGTTFRNVLEAVALGGGHRTTAGTYDEVADEIQLWFETGAADGFILGSLQSEEAFDDFATEVIPRLQDRGIYKREYRGTTLRENLGLPVPE